MTETISTAAVPTTDLEEQVKRRIEQVVSNDPQLAALLPEDSVTEAVNEPDLPLVEVIRRLLEGYGDRPALGQRAFEFVTGDDGATVIALKPEYTTVSYRELWERAEAIAAAWHEQGIRDGDFVAQLGFTSTDFASLDVAGLRLGTVSVPLQTGASLQQRNAILEETRPAVFAASIEYLDAAVDSVLATPSVRLLSVFDYHAEVDSQREALEAVRARLESAGRTIVVEALAEALARGRDLPAAPLPSADPDALRLLIYTSGSTGTPKGAMYPQWLVANLWQKKWLTDDVIPSIGVNFMPMSHLAGRLTLMGTLSGGGTASTSLRAIFRLSSRTSRSSAPPKCSSCRVWWRWCSSVFRQNWTGPLPRVRATPRSRSESRSASGNRTSAGVCSVLAPGRPRCLLR